jgi:uncharacterized membrane protein
MDKISFDRKHIVFGYSIISIVMVLVFYFSFLSSISDVSANEMSSIDSLQNVITQIHKEDSNLYKILLSEDILSSVDNEKSDNSNSVISNLLNLKSSELFTSVKLASTIDDYYSITNVRMEIIELYKAGESGEKINNLLELYESNVEIILSDVESEMKYIVEFRADWQKTILTIFIIIEFLLLILFLVTYFKFSSNLQSNYEIKSEKVKEDSENKLAEISEDMILDSDCRKILEFIGSETSRGNFPTFKDLKSHLGLSHPTVLAKINDLESRSLVGIRKQGRNKHLFLR